MLENPKWIKISIQKSIKEWQSISKYVRRNLKNAEAKK